MVLNKVLNPVPATVNEQMPSSTAFSRLTLEVGATFPAYFLSFITHNNIQLLASRACFYQDTAFEKVSKSFTNRKLLLDTCLWHPFLVSCRLPKVNSNTASLKVTRLQVDTETAYTKGCFYHRRSGVVQLNRLFTKGERLPADIHHRIFFNDFINLYQTP